MRYFPKTLFCTIRNLIEMLKKQIPSRPTRVGTWHVVLALMFRSMARVVVPVGLVSVSVLASLANAQISPNLPNPIAAPQPMTMTLSIFRSNMQDKIMKAADAMPESKYSYRPTKEGSLVWRDRDSCRGYFLTYCVQTSRVKRTPLRQPRRVRRPKIIGYLKGSFDYCDRVFSGFTDAHLNDPADFWGFKTNKMFILTQVGNHDALHYGNLVTYLRLNGLEPSSGWF